MEDGFIVDDAQDDDSTYDKKKIENKIKRKCLKMIGRIESI